MTHFVKFMRNPLTFAQRAVAFNNGTTHMHKYKSRSFTSNTCRRQPTCLSTTSYYYRDYGYYNCLNKNKTLIPFVASFTFFGLFGKKEEEEEDDRSKLIAAIKRSILLIQKREFKKAEQMLHLALRQAQTLQDQDGITYVYDTMANLAFEVGEFDKAQKLFKAVMQRVLSTGTPEDDLKIVHMSLKMAKILEHKGDETNAENGYKFCYKILQEHVNNGTEDESILTLWAMTLDWYAHLLLSISRYTEAMKLMEKAYIMCVKLHGEVHEQTVVLLNDLGSISFMKGNLDDAIEYLNKAAELGKSLPDMEDISSIHINLGNVYIKKGLLDEAKKACTKGWKLSKSKNNLESLEEANECLKEVNKLLTK